MRQNQEIRVEGIEIVLSTFRNLWILEGVGILHQIFNGYVIWMVMGNCRVRKEVKGLYKDKVYKDIRT